MNVEGRSVGRDGDKQRETPDDTTFHGWPFTFLCTRVEVTSVLSAPCSLHESTFFTERGPTFVYSSSYRRHHPLFRHTVAHSLGDDGLASSSRCCHGDAAVAGASREQFQSAVPSANER